MVKIFSLYRIRQKISKNRFFREIVDFLKIDYRSRKIRSILKTIFRSIQNVEPCLESVMEGVELMSRTSEPF